MFLGYNTNGFAHHRLEQTIDILADLGYAAAGITLDHHVLNPFEPDLNKRAEVVRTQLEHRNMRCVVETGARYLLDPRRKHQPTLISPSPEDRHRRIDFLTRAVDLAAMLDADAVSFWSGTAVDNVDQRELWDRLAIGCMRVLEHAIDKNVRLAFEPEPGMFVDRMDRFETLLRRVDHPLFGLTVDVGHLYCLGETPIAAQLTRWPDRLFNVHLDDMKTGVHDHLFFGQGQIDFPPIFDALKQIGYSLGIYAELSRHSHQAVDTARRAMTFLKPLTT